MKVLFVFFSSQPWGAFEVPLTEGLREKIQGTNEAVGTPGRGMRMNESPEMGIQRMCLWDTKMGCFVRL